MDLTKGGMQTPFRNFSVKFTERLPSIPAGAPRRRYNIYRDKQEQASIFARGDAYDRKIVHVVPDQARRGAGLLLPVLR